MPWLSSRCCTDGIVVRSLTHQQVEASHDQWIRIYRGAFSAPPYRKEEAEILDFAQSLPRHLENEGFRMVVASHDLAGQAVGFAYGFANLPEQWWYETVSEVVEPRIETEWLAGSYRLVEMAVVPTAQGRGIGGLLHDCILRGLPYPKAVLSTLAAETNAYRLYEKRGWQILLDGHTFRGVARPYRILGLQLEGT